MKKPRSAGERGRPNQVFGRQQPAPPCRTMKPAAIIAGCESIHRSLSAGEVVVAGQWWGGDVVSAWALLISRGPGAAAPDFIS